MGRTVGGIAAAVVGGTFLVSGGLILDEIHEIKSDIRQAIYQRAETITPEVVKRANGLAYEITDSRKGIVGAGFIAMKSGILAGSYRLLRKED